MTSRVQTLRFNVAGNRPTGQPSGVLYVNWPDKQLGVIDNNRNPLDLLPVRFFSATASYPASSIVLQAGKLYTANNAVSPGPFDPSQWTAFLSMGDVSTGYLPLNGGTLTGNLSIQLGAGGAPALFLNKATPTDTNNIFGMTNGVQRWAVVLGDGAAETGGNAGSDFVIVRMADTGAGIDWPLWINRANGMVNIGNENVSNSTIANFSSGNVNITGGAATLSGLTANAINCPTFYNNPTFTGNVQVNGTLGSSIISCPIFYDNPTFAGSVTVNGVLRDNGGRIISYGGGNPSLTAFNAAGYASCFFCDANGTIGIGDADGNGNAQNYRVSIDRGSTLATSQINCGTFYNNPNFTGNVNVTGTFHGNGAASFGSSLYVTGTINTPSAGIYYSGYWNHAHAFGWNNYLAAFVDNSWVGQIAFVSDYRIKRDVQPLGSMWKTVKELKPIAYRIKDYGKLFKADDKERWGFVAHELQETLIEDAATGHKDEDNVIQSPNPWTIIAALTKTLQEAMARIEALEGNAAKPLAAEV